MCTKESSFFSSVFPATLDFLSGEVGKVRSLPQCLHQSSELLVGIHWTGQCLASKSVEGGAGLQYVFGGLMTCAAWAFI